MSKASEIMERLDAVDVVHMFDGGKAGYAFLTLDELVDAVLGDEERGCASFQQTFRDVRDALREAFAELEERAMPEGYEWPRYEGGGLVQFGDIIGMQNGLWMGHPADEMVFRADGSVEVFGDGNSVAFERGEKAMRIVLAADGEPLEQGQTVYATRYDYARCTVLSFEWMCDGWLVEVENEGGHKFRQTPDELTHQRPALDASGIPIREGDTVYSVKDGTEYEVTGVDGAFEIRVKDESMDVGVWTVPCGFTHAKPEPPDSWERIRVHMDMAVNAYCTDVMGIDTGDMLVSEMYVTKNDDILRRCKALAERGE